MQENGGLWVSAFDREQVDCLQYKKMDQAMAAAAWGGWRDTDAVALRSLSSEVIVTKHKI